MDPREQADAISQDVSTPEEQLPSLTSPESPRMRALAAIEASNRARIEKETGVKLDDEPTSEPEPAPTPEPEPAPEPEPVVPKHKVKVDGAEQEVDTDTLIRTYQKNAAADRRLEEAAAILRQAEQIQLAAQLATPTEPAPKEDPPVDLKAQAAELLDKLYDGDKDSASEALVNLLAKVQGGQAPTPAPVQAVVDPEVLTTQVLERMAVNTAFERVKTDYPDIIADPNLEMLAAMQIDQRMAAGESRADAMIAVAEGLYKSLGKTPTGRQQAPTEPAKSSRQENLERLDPVPSASAAAAIQPQSPAESSPSSVIAELASRRLGQSLPR